MAQDSQSRKLDQYIVRFPDGMRDALKAQAAQNNRSLNAEIIARIEASFRDDGTVEQAINTLLARIEGQEATMQDIRSKFSLFEMMLKGGLKNIELPDETGQDH